METVVAVEESDKSKLEGTSALVITCSDSSKQIADPVVYKLARVVGDGIYIPATDDEVMKVEDLIDLQYVPDNSQTAICTSNDDTFAQEFCEGLLKFDDPSSQEERLDAEVDTTVDLSKLNSQFEEVTQSESTPVNDQIDQSRVRKQEEGEPSTSITCADWKPDFSKLKGEICLDNLSVRELHATFKATFGRETSVKDKQWLKRRISMGLSNSCDVSATTFIIENNKMKKKNKIDEFNNNKDENHNEVPFEGKNDSNIQMEVDNQGFKRVRKPRKRYIEEVSESDTRENNGSQIRVRPVYNIQPVRRPLVTRQDSLGGSGVEIPYVCRIRRGRPRDNFMALMKFQPLLVKKAHDEQISQSNNEIRNHEIKATATTGWIQQPLIKEPDELNNDSDEGHMDSYSDDNIITVPTEKGGMRRKHHRPWSLNEVVKFVEGVSRYGAGRWSEIKKISFATCSYRTSVNLKC